jgi:hypothetical protein
MRTVALLSRHGAHPDLENVVGVSRIPLSAEGEVQARALAQRVIELSTLHNLTLHPVIDTAPSLSSFQTASILADVLSRSAHRPFRVDQQTVLGAAFDGADALEAGTRVAMHLRFVVAELSRKSRASKLKVFIGHGATLLTASEELGLDHLSLLSSLTAKHCEPVLLEWTARGAWRILDDSVVDIANAPVIEAHGASRS